MVLLCVPKEDHAATIENVICLSPLLYSATVENFVLVSVSERATT